MRRVELIRERLCKAFQVSSLEVQDDSAKHVGHAGSQGGAGHYTVVIAAAELNGVSKVVAHRKIYAVLSDLIPHEIHALSIVVKSQ